MQSVSLKSPLNLKRSVTVAFEDGSVGSAHVSRDEVMERLLEKKIILLELEEKVTKSEKNDNSKTCASLSQKNKTALRDVEGAQHSFVGTRDGTTVDKEDQRGTSRAGTTTTGNPGLRTTPREVGRVGAQDNSTASGRC